LIVYFVPLLDLGWAYSLLMLGVLRGRPGRWVWLVSLVANGVSYAAMLLILFVARWTGIV
jgi:hypothetical protein